MNLIAYGSLRKGQGADTTFLSEATHEGTTVLKGFDLYEVSWFPGIKPGDPAAEVVVDFWSGITDQMLKALDRYEGHPNLFRREEVETPLGKAWVYIYNHPISGVRGHGKISSGDWVRRAS